MIFQVGNWEAIYMLHVNFLQINGGQDSSWHIASVKENHEDDDDNNDDEDDNNDDDNDDDDDDDDDNDKNNNNNNNNTEARMRRIAGELIWSKILCQITPED